MYPDHISQAIVEWVREEMGKILEVSKIDANYVSPAERKINNALHEKTYDIFWRCVRLNKNDVGQPHRDSQFWELQKGTDDEVPVPFAYRNRWKLWVPLIGCVKENSLQMMPFSHQEEIPTQVIDTPFGRRPAGKPSRSPVRH